MHCSWFMSLLILLLFSLFSINKADDYSNIYHDDDDESPKTPIILNTYPTHPLWEGQTEGLGDDPVETTTPSKKSTTSDLSHDDDDVDYFHHLHVDTDDDETDDHTTSTTTKLSSSSSSSSTKEIKLSTSSSTETTTTESKITVTRSTWLFYGRFTTTTIDLKIIAAYLAKTNRDRFFLKIFAITVVVGMFGLAIALISIHIVRKTGRYHGYRTPANASAKEQSKHLNV